MNLIQQNLVVLLATLAITSVVYPSQARSSSAQPAPAVVAMSKYTAS